MPKQQPDEFSPEVEELTSEKAATSDASGGKQTPIDSDIRTTGSGSKTDAKPTAEQESGDSDPLVEGGGNQGTEKR